SKPPLHKVDSHKAPCSRPTTDKNRHIPTRQVVLRPTPAQPRPPQTPPHPCGNPVGRLWERRPGANTPRIPSRPTPPTHSLPNLAHNLHGHSSPMAISQQMELRNESSN